MRDPNAARDPACTPAATPPPLLRLWLAKTASGVADSVGTLLLPLVILDSGRSVVALGALRAAGGLGTLAAALVAGVLADALRKRPLLIACDLGRAVLYGAAGPWLLSGGDALEVLCVVAAGGAVLDVSAQVGQMSLVPELVPAHGIARATGLLTFSYAASRCLGPLLAGVAAVHMGPRPALACCAALFLLSVVLLVGLPQGERPAPATGGTGGARALWAGWRFVRGQATLRSTLLFLSLVTLLAAGGQDLFIYRIERELAGGHAGVAWAFGLASLGAIAGAFTAAWCRRRLGFRTCFVASLALQALLGGLVGLAPTVAWVAAGAAGYALVNSGLLVHATAIRQELSPAHVLGRVNSLFVLVPAALAPLAAIAITAVAGRLGAGRTLVGVGLAGALVALAARRAPLADEVRRAP